jgi:hypothetical protein
MAWLFEPVQVWHLIVATVILGIMLYETRSIVRSMAERLPPPKSPEPRPFSSFEPPASG